MNQTLDIGVASGMLYCLSYREFDLRGSNTRREAPDHYNKQYLRFIWI